MKVLVILLSLYVNICFSAEDLCPKEMRLPDLPVQDQDGSGTCYSNTASLMMQHKLKLKVAPSYQQMAMMAASYGEIKNSNLTMPGEIKDTEQLFSAGGRACEAINHAMSEGWCDADQFTLDVINGNDSLNGQNYFLVNFAKMLEKNNSILTLLSNASPSEFEALKSRLAGLLIDKNKMCEKPFREFIGERLLAKVYIHWRDHLNTLTGERKERFLKLMSLSFDNNGLPKKDFKIFVDKNFIEEKINYYGQYYYQNKKRPNDIVKPPGALFYYWSNYNKIKQADIVPIFKEDALNIPFPYAVDAEMYGSCFIKNGSADALNLFLQHPNCASPIKILPEKDLELAGKYLKAMKEFNQAKTPDEKFRDFMKLVFPRCGEQLSLRDKHVENKISCTEVINLENKASSDILTTELCKTNPVGIAVCGDFIENETPINLKKCTKDAAKALGKKNSLHIVTVVGYRTNEVGKRMFLVQNSWGSGCPFYNKKEFKKSFTGLVDCEEKQGVLTGRFWIEEDFLMNNTKYLSVLKESK